MSGLPQVTVLPAEDSADPPPVISPLTPQLAPTFRAAAAHLSPFWFSAASPELAQLPGSTSAAQLPADSGAAALSMLHAAAITGNTDALEKLASGNFCDIDLRDKEWVQIINGKIFLEVLFLRFLLSLRLDRNVVSSWDAPR